MGINKFLSAAMTKDTGIVEGPLHRASKKVEEAVDSILGTIGKNAVNATLTNVADTIERIGLPIVDEFKEIHGLFTKEGKVANTFKLALHTPLAIIDSLYAATRSVVGLPAKFIIRGPLATIENFVSSDFGPKAGFVQGLIKGVALPTVPYVAGNTLGATTAGASLGGGFSVIGAMGAPIVELLTGAVGQGIQKVRKATSNGDREGAKFYA